jgi:hypothetical protein
MSKMVEQVARAICCPEGCIAGDGPTPCMNAEEWYPEARAAIEAMREPDEAQREALSALGRATVQDEHERDNWCWFAILAYRAMISEALK